MDKSVGEVSLGQRPSFTTAAEDVLYARGQKTRSESKVQENGREQRAKGPIMVKEVTETTPKEITQGTC